MLDNIEVTASLGAYIFRKCVSPDLTRHILSGLIFGLAVL